MRREGWGQMGGEDGGCGEEMGPVCVCVSVGFARDWGMGKGKTYGVGSTSEGRASSRRRDASLIRLSSSFILGTTCLTTMILSNSFYKARHISQTHSNRNQISLSHHHQVQSQSHTAPLGE